MGDQSTIRVLIIGAGSMGLIVGHHLGLDGTSVAYLIRPHRGLALSKPQKLYSYNDHQLRAFTDYEIFTSPNTAFGTHVYDFILITLDAASLRNDTGRALVHSIGTSVRHKDTQLVLGAVFPNLKAWFCSESGLPEDRVTIAALAIHAYSTDAVSLPVHPPTNFERLSEATLAYADSLGPGLLLDNSSPAVAEAFAALYNRNGVSTCSILPPHQLALQSIPFFAILATCDLMDWPKFTTINASHPLWTRGVGAMAEIQRLPSVRGTQPPTGPPPPSQVLASCASMERALLPLDLQEFNRYHHGRKVSAQDRAILVACKSEGQAHHIAMPALAMLLRDLGQHE